jgi:hypothetical protein
MEKGASPSPPASFNGNPEEAELDVGMYRYTFKLWMTLDAIDC